MIYSQIKSFSFLNLFESVFVAFPGKKAFLSKKASTVQLGRTTVHKHLLKFDLFY